MPELNIPPVAPNPEAKSVEVLVRRGAAELEARGVNWRRIADSHGLDLDREPAPGRSIPTERENAFLMEATQAAGDLLFTWHLGRVDVRSYGLPMYASLNAATVGEAMELARLLTPTLCEAVALNVVVEGDTATIIYTSAASRKNSVFSLRATLNFLEHLLGPSFVPTRCGIDIADREHLPAIASQIAAPVSAALPYAFVSLPARLLRSRVDGADERLAETLRPFWKRELARHAGELAPTRSRVEGAIVQNLHRGLPTIDLLAHTLSTSRSKLRADLAAIGGLRPTIDDVRRRLAGELLACADLPAAQVATLLGFSEPEALSHACRRWTGQGSASSRAPIDA